MCKGNTTESGKAGGGSARRIVSRGVGLLAVTNIAKSLLAVPPPMAGLDTIPLLEGGAIGGWLSMWISACGVSCVGKKRDEGLCNTVRD